jgi:hypothetical protein
MNNQVSPYELRHVDKLDGENYSTWRTRITFTLKREKLWSIVDGNEIKPVAPTGVNAPPLPTTGQGSIIDWDDRNLFALTILVNSVKNSCLHHITRVATAKETWDELQAIYQVSNISNRVYLRRKFIKLKMDDDKSMSEHIHMFRSVLDELIVVGVTIQDDEQLETFFGSISQSYQNVVDVLSNTAGITLSTAMSKLLHEELRRKSDCYLNESSSSSSVFWTKKKSNFQKRKVINTHKRFGPPLNKSSYNKNIQKVKCFNCNHYGHISKDCTNTKQEKKPNGHKLNIASEKPPILSQSRSYTLDNSEEYNEVFLCSIDGCVFSKFLNPPRQQVPPLLEQTPLSPQLQGLHLLIGYHLLSNMGLFRWSSCLLDDPRCDKRSLIGRGHSSSSLIQAPARL